MLVLPGFSLGFPRPTALTWSVSGSFIILSCLFTASKVLIVFTTFSYSSDWGLYSVSFGHELRPFLLLCLWIHTPLPIRLVSLWICQLSRPGSTLLDEIRIGQISYSSLDWSSSLIQLWRHLTLCCPSYLPDLSHKHLVQQGAERAICLLSWPSVIAMSAQILQFSNRSSHVAHFCPTDSELKTNSADDFQQTAKKG